MEITMNHLEERLVLPYQVDLILLQLMMQQLKVGLPRTAVAVEAGLSPSSEYDNAVQTGVYSFATVDDAKIVLTNPANYYGSSINPLSDATNDNTVAAIPAIIAYTTLSTGESTLDNSVLVSPNPFYGLITIKNSGVSLMTVVVTDVNRRKVAQYNLEGTRNDKTLDLRSRLSSGQYLLTIAS